MALGKKSGIKITVVNKKDQVVMLKKSQASGYMARSLLCVQVICIYINTCHYSLRNG